MARPEESLWTTAMSDSPRSGYTERKNFGREERRDGEHANRELRGGGGILGPGRQERLTLSLVVLRPRTLMIPSTPHIPTLILLHQVILAPLARAIASPSVWPETGTLLVAYVPIPVGRA